MIKCSRTAQFSDLALVLRREPVRVKNEYVHRLAGRALAGKKRIWRIVRMRRLLKISIAEQPISLNFQVWRCGG